MHLVLNPSSFTSLLLVNNYIGLWIAVSLLRDERKRKRNVHSDKQLICAIEKVNLN